MLLHDADRLETAMKNVAICCLTALLLSGISAQQKAAPTTRELLIGSYNVESSVDLETSENDPTRRLRRLTFTWSDEWLTCKAMGTTASGHEREFWSYRAKFDGKEYAFLSHPNNTVSLQPLNQLTWLQVEKKEGKLIAAYTETLSEDGKTLKVVVVQRGEDGKSTFHLTTAVK